MKAIFKLRPRVLHSLISTRFSSRLAPIVGTAFHLPPANSVLEEEASPNFSPKRFYPARIGEKIQKYQIVSKLGWGTDSTVWLAKDVNRFVQSIL